jgi:hypothetical protein
MNKHILWIAFLVVANQIFAQVGGEHVYEFLNLSSSARVTGLGGHVIAVQDDSDVVLGYNNPAALNPRMHQELSFNYNFYVCKCM